MLFHGDIIKTADSWNTSAELKRHGFLSSVCHKAKNIKVAKPININKNNR
jgi:hypothetical protein